MSNTATKQASKRNPKAVEVLIYGLIVVLMTTIGTGIAAYLAFDNALMALAGSSVVAFYWFLTLRD